MKRSILLFTCFIAGTTTFAQNKKEKAPAPPPPPPKVEVVKFVPPVAEMIEFNKRNPSVADAYWSKKQNLIIKLKNNTKEEYNLADEKEKNEFIKKYGNPPPPLPPPPVPTKSWQ